MAIRHITAEEFDREVLQAKGLVLVDFFATWCGPCRMIAPILEEIDREGAGCDIVKIDVDEAEEIAIRYGVEGIPTLIVFENGAESGRQVGLCGKDAIVALIGS